jgi:hypothetical protein
MPPDPFARPPLSCYVQQSMPTAPDDPPLNPYEAPQTIESQLPRAEDQASKLPSRMVVIPTSTQRWMYAARLLYGLAFFVPFQPWHAWNSAGDNVHWFPFLGLLYFAMGIFMCWHPLGIPWGANICLLLSQRNLYRGNIERGAFYATLGMILAISFFLLWWWWGEPGFERQRVTLNAPYFCWLAAMILQLIAAVDLGWFHKNRADELSVHEHA